MATKIKDGVFIGDAEASQDPEFIELNKITFVINCAGRQLPNLWEQHGLHYLTFPWTSDPDCVLFDGGNVVIVQITNFINEALEKGESVLVHSSDGTGRCIACLTAYLMFRHRWGFEKALDFLCNKRPDAAPNAGFIQQLYHLDLRLCGQWYGHGIEPPEKERLRHDQWVPIVPETIPEHRQKHVDGRTAGRQASFTSGRGRGKNDAVVAATAAHNAENNNVASQTSFPGLGRLTEVQEEELVLVHSFLNSQPQIDALPPGQANYEDHVSKELHWIDRPRMDKLAASGRLGRDERHPHTIPVSPRTGRAVPERPANNSYNALSRDTRSSVSRTIAPPVGILKRDKKSKRSSSMDGAGTISPLQQALESEACGLETTVSGDSVVAAANTECAGGEALPSSRRTGEAKMGDEVVVEDLSEPRSDRWSSDVGDGSIEADKYPRGASASSGGGGGGGNFSSDRQERGPRLSPNGATTDASFSAEEEDVASTDTVGSRRDEHDPESSSTVNPRDCPLREAPSNAAQARSFGRGSSSNQDNAPALRSSVEARKEERQAWDGRYTNTEGVEGTKERGRSRTSRVDDNNRGEPERTQRRVDKARSGDKTTSASSRVPTTAPSSNRPTHNKAVPVFAEVSAQGKEPFTRWDGQGGPGGSTKGSRQRDGITNQIKSGGERSSLNMVATDIDELVAVEGPTPASSAKSIRRTGSEGSIIFSPTELGKTLSQQPDKSSLPQAPLGRTRIAPTNPPGPGWGPADMSSDHTAAKEGPRQSQQGRGRRTKEDAYGEGDGTWTREVPTEQEVHPAGECRGSLQQLAQTPNPQLRKLPSPRPNQERNQEGRAQRTSDPGYIFPQQRPSSAPSQRPDAPKVAGDPEEDWVIGGRRAASPVNAEPVGKTTTSSSSCVGTPNQGYPVHGLMPSGSMRQLSGHDRGGGRWGTAAGGKNVCPRPVQTPGVPTGAAGDGSGRGGSRGDMTSSSPAGGGSYVSTESQRLARVSPGGGVDAEPPRGSDARLPKDNGSGGGGGGGGGGVGPLPRDIRASQLVASSTDPSRSRIIGSELPLASEHSAGGSGTDRALSQGGSRRGSGGSNSYTAASQVVNGLMRPGSGSLPRPSRKGANTSRESGSYVREGGGETGRWASPIPRGRQGDAARDGTATATNSYSGSVESRGHSGGGGGAGGDGVGGGSAGGTVPARTRRNSPEAYSAAHSHRPRASNGGRGGGPRPNRAGAAPTYRFGSPAPTRGRRSATGPATAASAAGVTSDPSRFFRQQRTQGPRNPQGSGIPPGFRGEYGQTPSGGYGGGVSVVGGRGSAHRSPAPSPTARDRPRKGADSSEVGRQSVQRRPTSRGLSPSGAGIRSAADGSTGGQRPSTSEGLPGSGGGGAGGGRRGRSPSPAPRPSSASGRRRSASPSPAHLLGTPFGQGSNRIGVTIDPSFDRPRWK